METTGRALVDHWNWAAGKGLMNKNTAGALRAACSQVLAVDEDWENLDVSDLDVEGILARFTNLRAKDFKPASLETYRKRFRLARDTFIEYTRDPGAWKPRMMERSPAQEKTNGNGATEPTTRAVRHEMSSSGMVEYPFPIRDGQNARLVLPRDLKRAEAKRLAAFINTLATDFDPEA